MAVPAQLFLARQLLVVLKYSLSLSLALSSSLVLTFLHTLFAPSSSIALSSSLTLILCRSHLPLLLSSLNLIHSYSGQRMQFVRVMR
jgi:hypothetical protein